MGASDITMGLVGPPPLLRLLLAKSLTPLWVSVILQMSLPFAF
jgi:hypothetical protein